MKLFLIALAMSMILPRIALADRQADLPDFHLDEKCRAQSKSVSGKASSPVTEECATSERAAYDMLKQYWPKLDEREKTKCLAASSNQKLGNYRILQQCLNRDVLRVDGQLKTDPKK